MSKKNCNFCEDAKFRLLQQEERIIIGCIDCGSFYKKLDNGQLERQIGIYSEIIATLWPIA
jgi:hypothetical protein